ncbi:MAG: PAS domain S-box protein [Magnetococcales bacterium]|nr:PAS domain S-box protein [Magnetococcales bacterium]NGZ26582.1 PAS domain S-box protein [Magnetococcales bacterium]
MSINELEDGIGRLRAAFLAQLPDRIADMEHSFQNWQASKGEWHHLDELHLFLQRLIGSSATFDFLELSEKVRPFSNLVKRLLNRKNSPDQEIIGWVASHLVELKSYSVHLQESFQQQSCQKSDTRSVPYWPTERQVFILCQDEDLIQQFQWEISKRDHQICRFNTLEEMILAMQDGGMPAGLVIDMDMLPQVDADVRIYFESKYRNMQTPVPVIILSSQDGLNARLRAVRMGGNHFSHKPVNVFKLSLLLTPWLKTAPLEPYRVLLVDDDDLLIQYYQIVLASAGFQVEAIQDPFRLLDVMHSFNPEVVVLDLYLPGCNGIELASVIRQSEMFITTPILFLSAEENLGRRLSDQHLAHMDHLLKPVYPTALIRAVSARIKQARARSLMEEHLRSALQELENFQFALNQHAIVSATDHLGRITYVNDKFCEISEYSPHELIGATHRIVNSGFHPSSFFQGMWETILSGQVWHGQVKNRRKDGTFYWVEATIVPFMDEHGYPREFISIRTEITHQKKTEEEARSMALFAEMNPSPVFRLDRSGHILEANPAAVQILGIGDKLGEKLSTLLPNAEHLDVDACIRDNETIALALQLEDHYYQFVLHGVADLGVCHAYGFDVTDLENARGELQEAKEYAESLINSSLDMIISVDINRRISQFNPAAERCFGYRQDEVLGRTTDFLYADPDEVEKLRSITWVNGQFKGEIRSRRKNGEFFYCFLSSSPLYDKSGRRIGYMGISRDITELKMAEEVLRENEQRIRAILESTVDGIIVADEKGIVELYNSSAERIFGYAAEEVMGQNLNMLMPEPYASEHDAYLQNYLSSGIAKIIGVGREVEGRRKTGQTVPLFLSVSEFRLGEKRMFTGVVSDITARKQAEMDLRAAKEAAEKASRAKSEFLSSMSHELRTPMNAVLGFSQLMQSDPTEPLSESQQDSVQEIISAGQHLLELINEVLDLAKIEAGRVQLTMEEVSLREVLEECLSLVSALALQKGILVELEEMQCQCVDILVNADRMRLKQVFLNLLSNAIKYNRDNGRVMIRCILLDEEQVQVLVVDTGKGIATEHLGSVFEPFNRLGAEHSSVEGTGIGLVITKRLVENMGGSIGVSSQLGVGSTFHLILRAVRKVTSNREDGTTVIDEEVSCGVSQERKIFQLLYVEDNPANLKLVERLIQRRNDFQLLAAPSPVLGLDLARARRPDLILLDINLPGMNGYEVLKRLKDDPEVSSIPVVAISANAMPQDVAKGLSMGFRRYLTKPLDVHLFMETLDAIVEERLHAATNKKG